MKKLLSLLLLVGLTVTLFSCKTKPTAEELANNAYNNLSEAYTLLDEFDNDITGTMKFCSSGEEWTTENLAKNLNISEAELLDGFRVIFESNFNEEFNYEIFLETTGLDAKDNEVFKAYANSVLSNQIEKNPISQISLPFTILFNAYIKNGTIEKIDTLITQSQNQLGELENNYPEYEHLPTLKLFKDSLKDFFDKLNPENSEGNVLKAWLNEDRDTLYSTANELKEIFE